MKCVLKFFYLVIGNPSKICDANGACIDSTSSDVGVPSRSIIISTWFIVDVPGNIALPIIISPRMHPILHISTAFEYRYEPSNISGALYHLVATYSVSTGATNEHTNQYLPHRDSWQYVPIQNQPT